MKKLVLYVMFGVTLAAMLGFTQASAASSLTGQVMMNGRAASAAVMAIPYNPLTHETIEGKAMVTPTDADGRFSLTSPSGNFLLVAWDGRNGVIVDSPATTVTLTMTDQTPPMYQVAANCTYKCECHHLFGNIYVVWMWGNSITCGSYQYLSWGCHC